MISKVILVLSLVVLVSSAPSGPWGVGWGWAGPNPYHPLHIHEIAGGPFEAFRGVPHHSHWDWDWHSGHSFGAALPGVSTASWIHY